jgi:hypothetical protein
MTSYVATTDPEIRLALHNKRLRHVKSQPDTLVIDELGLAHAQSRIDVAVINGCIHGYEIKSAKDDLNRLDRQIAIYRQTLQKLTIVADSKHLQGISANVPEWCGIIEAKRGLRGGISLELIRPASKNPDINLVMMAHLLWRPEILQLLAQLGYAPRELRLPRKQLYELLCETLSPREITAAIRKFMMQREAWRDQTIRA